MVMKHVEEIKDFLTNVRKFLSPSFVSFYNVNDEITDVLLI